MQRRPFRVLLLSLACSASLAALSAQAQAATSAAPINIPAGELVTALDALARQSGAQFVYRADQLQGLRTSGVQGARSAQEAVDRLLQGSQFVAQRDASGAMVIVKRTAPAKPRVARQVSQAPQAPAPAEAPLAVQELETIQVTGSRIPRAQIEGPAPITLITAEQIQAAGLTSVPDLLRSLAQNSGSVYGQQNTTNAQSTPGA
ncbi:MAG: secretin and TonB N-terminal domain-containing protein, partial [Pseudoxanthomonas sp.]